MTRKIDLRESWPGLALGATLFGMIAMDYSIEEPRNTQQFRFGAECTSPDGKQHISSYQNNGQTYIILREEIDSSSRATDESGIKTVFQSYTNRVIGIERAVSLDRNNQDVATLCSRIKTGIQVRHDILALR